MNAKKTLTKRITAVILSMLMLVSAIPLTSLTAFAETVNSVILVKDGDMPVANANVIIKLNDVVTEEKNTDEFGKVEFVLDGNNNYTYSVSKLGYDSADGAIEMSEAETVVSLNKKSTVTIQGGVYDEESQPLKDVKISICGYNSYETTTKDDGIFNISGVYEGESYSITAYCDGYISVTQTLSLKDFNFIVLKEKSNPDLTFSPASIEMKYGEKRTVYATAVNGNSADSYKSSDESIIKVSMEGNVEAVGIGTAKITASVNETDTMQSGMAECIVTVTKGLQNELKWENTIPKSIKFGDTFSNQLTGGSGDGEVTYKSSDDNIAVVDSNGLLTTVSTGTVVVTATKKGGAKYEDASLNYELKIEKADQEKIVFNTPFPDAITYGESYKNVISGGTTNNAVKYSVSDSEIAEIDSNGVLTTKKSGDVTVTAVMPGNEKYNDVYAQYDITIKRADRKEEFSFAKGRDEITINYGDDFDNTAKYADSSVIINYKSSSPEIAQVGSDGKITAKKAGTVIITASIPEDEQFNSKEISYTLTVNKADQTVEFKETVIDSITYGEKYSNPASAKTTITYSSSDEDIAEVNNDGSLKIKKAGTVRITASAAENDCYNSASESYTLTINKAEQNIVFEKGDNPAVTFSKINNIFVNKATGNTEQCVYSCKDEANIVSDFNTDTGEFKFINAGKVIVNVTFAENDCYNKATKSYELTINKADQKIYFNKREYNATAGEFFNDSLWPSLKIESDYCNENTPVYSVKSDESNIVKSIDSSTGEVTLTNEVGEAVIVASKDGDRNFNEATAEYTLKVDEWSVTQKYYTIEGAVLNKESDWFAGVVTIKAKQGYLLSKSKTNSADNIWCESMQITDDGIHNVSFYVKRTSDGLITRKYLETIKKDTVKPESSIAMNEVSLWEKLLTFISFGTFQSYKTTFSVKAEDKMSSIKSVEYFIDNDETKIKSTEELDSKKDIQWLPYSEKGIVINTQKKFVLYIKTTDNAGNYIYTHTNGVIIDYTKPEISINLPTSNNSFFNNDVNLNVIVNDAKYLSGDEYVSSGLKLVEYKILCNEILTQSGVLWKAYDDETVPDLAEKDLQYSLTLNDILVDCEKNNSDNVKVIVTVADNAGNVSEKTQELKISATKPEISISYDNNDCNVENERGYFDSERTATVKIKNRTSVFSAKSATEGIVIKAKDAKGNTPTDENGKPVKDENGNRLFDDNGIITEAGRAEMISEWKTTEGETPDDAIHTATISFGTDANYDLSISYTDEAENSNIETINTGDSVTPFVFTVDTHSPTAEITAEKSTWDKLVETLTFGLYSKTSVKVTAKSDDKTSPIKSVEYFKSDRITAYTKKELDSINAESWQLFESYTSVPDERFAVYLKTTDYAGNYSYISTDGYIVEDQKCDIEIEPSKTVGKGYFNKENIAVINITVTEPNEIHSGIAEVSYKVICDEIVTENETIMSFDKVNPDYSDLETSFNSTITIDSLKNNSDNVKVIVTAADNAGNVSEKTQELKISATKPEISISYDNNDCNVENERGYFDSERTATVKIKNRTSVFSAKSATEGIVIKAKDAKGNTPTDENGKPVKDENGNRLFDDNGIITEAGRAEMISEWKTTEGETPDDAIHTATISFGTDANYDLSISYTDEAENSNIETINTGDSVTPFVFTVDTHSPTAEITAEKSTWDKLVETLTFGLYSKTSVKVTAKSDDKTSPIKSVEYFKSDRITAYTKKELDSINAESWQLFESYTSVPDERFAVYLKTTDYAGNYSYVSTDGYIVEDKKSTIDIDLPDTKIICNGIGVYNGDVNAVVSVSEPEPHSGIKSIRYYVKCDGKITQQNTIEYNQMNPTYSEIKHSEKFNVLIESVKNNSCNVELFVETVDNAGNVSNESEKIDIDIIKPEFSVSYDNNSPYKVSDGRGYFPDSRTAEISIRERSAHFDGTSATSGIVITAKDAKGNTPKDKNGKPITDKDGNRLFDDKGVITEAGRALLIGKWVTTESENHENAVHTAKVSFDFDANFNLSMSYTDEADNKCKEDINIGTSSTPFSFTIDKTAPTGSVTAEGLGTWDKLIETLTFGLWSKNTVSIHSTSDDVTSPIESVSYYKTPEMSVLSATELASVSSWKLFDGIEVFPNERFTVYLRIVDYAGNTSYISTNGIITDSQRPVVENISPKVTITPEQPINGIYNKDVSVAVSVKEPKSDNAASYSGINQIRYEILNMGVVTQSGILYQFNETSPNGHSLLDVWNKDDAIIVNKELNNSNDVEINVYAVDNAGNSGFATKSIKIDVTRPSITVSYDNNDGDTSFGDNTYFKANRTATIRIAERNFDPEMVNVICENENKSKCEMSGWSTSEGSGNGDDTIHTAQVYFRDDGDYTFDISCTDKVLNENSSVNYGTSLAPQRFTIDKIEPTVSIVYDNDTFKNGNYYDKARTATITVNEHNFETSRVKAEVSATDNGVQRNAPALSSWTSNGDIHTATITYSDDAHYIFNFEYTDMAGNKATAMERQEFYVDKTKPVVSISNIVDKSANGTDKSIGFNLKATDTNFDVFTPRLEAAVFENGKYINKNVTELGNISDVNNGREFIVSNIDQDGIYNIKCTVVDKAGNAYSEVILNSRDGSSYKENRSGEDRLLMFSVNRDGAVFELDSTTSDLIDKYYVQNVTDDIKITEINADSLIEYKVNLNSKALIENEGLIVDISGDDDEWKKYDYTIKKYKFEEEGEYKVVVSSKDKADNNDFSDVKDAAINFVVDRTAPVVSISGLAEDGRYQVQKQKVTLLPTDDGGELKSLVVNLVDNNGEKVSELLNLTGDKLKEKLENDNGKVNFEISEGLYQNIQIICTDCSVNEHGETNTYKEVFKNVSVSSNIFMIFWANRVLRYSVIGGIVLLIGTIIFVVVFKKRKSKEKTKCA